MLPTDLPDVDVAYKDFCNIIKKAAKTTISHGYQNNYIPFWGAECESLHTTLLQSPKANNSSLTATALLVELDRKRKDKTRFVASSFF